MPIGIPLFKACVVAAAVFALAWLRFPMSLSGLESLLRIFIWYGIFIGIITFVVGYPLALLLQKFRIVRWWSSAVLAAIAGALLAGMITFRPKLGVDEVPNPRALSFSPWNRRYPGIIDDIPLSLADFVGSVVFGVIVGAALGLAFWYFYRRGARSA
jgi:hypothetical protein